MEIRNNYTPVFSGLLTKSSYMQKAQKEISDNVFNKLYYADEFVRVKDDLHVYMLPDKSGKSVIVRFIEGLSQMYFTKGNAPLQVTIHGGSDDCVKGVNEIRTILKDIKAGKYEAPEFDIDRCYTASTDLDRIYAGDFE